MRLSWSWALLAWTVAVVRANCGCGESAPRPLRVISSSSLTARCGSTDVEDCGAALDVPSPSYSGAEIITYGEPCSCRQQLPYSIQVPEAPVSQISLPIKSYGYDVQPEKPRGCNIGFELPVKIQAPLNPSRSGSIDIFAGRTYGVDVQGPAASGPAVPARHQFDFAIQHSVPGSGPRSRGPDYSIDIHPGGPGIGFGPGSGFGPLPYKVEAPLVQHGPSSAPLLSGLTSKVDRILIPACDVDACPICAESPTMGRKTCTCTCV